MVEVKNQDGIYQEATINKLTDASLYTVGKWFHSIYLTLKAAYLYNMNLFRGTDLFWQIKNHTDAFLLLCICTF